MIDEQEERDLEFLKKLYLNQSPGIVAMKSFKPVLGSQYTNKSNIE